MKIASKSDIGRVRSSNQDSFSAGEIRGAAWAIVCDGMGGANGGNIASGKAVKTISDCITAAYHSEMSKNGVSAMLESAIIAANLNIYDEAAENESLAGMGTTVVAAIVEGEDIILAHAGDSRAYIYENGIIRQITRDHSVVQKMVERGEITPDEAKNDPRKNVITRALGVSEDIEIEFGEEVLAKNAVLILCTDGLTNFVDPGQMSDVIGNNAFE
ncbi:MAG: Stp1/IreP family PP2C-type Ser/Thr phosphatase, partial [Clostridia bacterium]|nr:Stp1/IreP family PP2C-type Ser/Thr phosphatase [Clostridia bacterium]